MGQWIDDSREVHLSRYNSAQRLSAAITSSKQRVVIITFYQNRHTIDNNFLY